MGILRKCSVADCNEKHFAKTFCVKHYARFQNHGDPNFTITEMHGQSKTKEYSAWSHMVQRCENEKCSEYKYYGARGISVCPEWKSFSRFLSDMGKSPAGLELDRIDNNGNYCPSNCRWISKLENTRNTRRTKLNRDLVLEIRNSDESTRVLARKHNIHHAHISRVKRALVWGDIVDPLDCDCTEFAPVFPRMVPEPEKKEVD